ncbi:MAG: glycosyltransferase family 39 protein [Anaerolineae bacterium]|nr:glycosyltransferase family 39 protein [Anaerolineae bacterium]
MINSAELSPLLPVSQRHWQALLAIVVFAFLALGVVYAWATPPLEASDEYKHYPVVQHIQTTGELVILDADNPGRWLQEGAQPPLYYLMMAALTADIDTSDLPVVHQRNPHAFVGDPNQIHNKNLIIHNPDRQAFPGSGSILAVNVIRLASLLLGAGTIVVTAHLGRLLFSARVGLLAAALTAFNPMFLFVHAAVNNDSLAIFLGSLGIWLLVRLWRQFEAGEVIGTESRTIVQFIVLGIVLGLGILTKLSVGGLLGLTGSALAWQSWQRRNWRPVLIGGSIIITEILIISGWWFVRNMVLHGDLTGLIPFIAVQGTRDAPLQLSGWLAEFGTFYRTYWGLFGGVNVAAPQWIYVVCNLLLVGGMVGLIVYRRERGHFPSGTWLLAAWAVLLFLLLVRWNIISPAFQGRLLFPALGAVNVLWAAGWVAWERALRRRFGHKVWIELWITGYFLVIAVVIPWITIRPAYAWPQALLTVPASAEFGPITYMAPDGAIQLVGVDLAPEQTTTPGSDAFIRVTLYWQASEPVANNYVSTVHLLGRDFDSVGNVSRYPGWGMVPTSRWHTGEIWRDEYGVRVNADAAAPSVLRLDVGLYDVATDSDLPAMAADGTPLEFVLVGEGRLTSAENPVEPTTILDIPFEQGITLRGYTIPNTLSPGATVPVTLTWQAEATPDTNYTVFVQLIDETGNLVASGDGPPVGGFYPTTMWQTGEWIGDRHELMLSAELQPGPYTIAVGLYDPATLVRVPRRDGDDAVTWPVTLE